MYFTKTNLNLLKNPLEAEATPSPCFYLCLTDISPYMTYMTYMSFINTNLNLHKKINPPESEASPAPSLSQKGWSAQPRFLDAPSMVDHSSLSLTLSDIENNQHHWCWNVVDNTSRFSASYPRRLKRTWVKIREFLVLKLVLFASSSKSNNYSTSLYYIANAHLMCFNIFTIAHHHYNQQ